MLVKRLAVLVASSALALGVAAGPAFAGGGYHSPKPPHGKKGKCNSGNGNGSDPITFVVGAHCYGGDPGNSYNAGNRGGDEIPTSDGVPNPGGNNVD